MIDCPEEFYHQKSGLEIQLDALDKKVDFIFDLSQKTVKETKDDLDKRLETMNEFRAQLLAQAGTFATKKELRTDNEKIEQRVDLIISSFKEQVENRLLGLEKRESKEEGGSFWKNYIIMAAISAATFFIANFILKH